MIAGPADPQLPGYGELIHRHASAEVYFMPPAIYALVGTGPVTGACMEECFRMIYAHPRFQDSHGIIFHPGKWTIDRDAQALHERGIVRPATLIVGVSDSYAMHMLGRIINVSTRRYLKTPFAVKSTYQEAVQELQRALDRAAAQGPRDR